jgi:hypothetical protein
MKNKPLPTRFPGLGKRLAVTLLCACASLIALDARAQWTALSNTAPNNNNGVMLLLPDGRILCKTGSGGDSRGNLWDILTPNSSGSYANGTWTTSAAMSKTRLYFISQVLKDGRVFVAGGEYGTGGNYMEVYNPQTDNWANEVNYGAFISDANSEMLPDGRVLGAPVGNRPNTFIWNPATNSFVAGPSNIGNTNESAWVKLPDSSILFIRTSGTVSERYMPKTNTWSTDATVPVALYEPLGAETGAAFMLPDGRAFFLGGNSNTAYYTPSGTTANGTWTAGPSIPNSLSAPDAAAAMMRDGKILCAVSPTLTCCDGNGNNIFNTPTSFYIFDYTAGSNGTFTSITAPGGGSSLNIPSYKTNMLDLPNGQVLYSQQGSNQYYVYTPGSQLSANRPVITNIKQHNDGSFTLTGTQITGWSEGAGYGDDWQMNTNYPIVQLTNGSNVYYARTYNWNSTAVRAGSVAQTTDFVLPGSLPAATYQLRVIANGIASDPVSFCTPHIEATAIVTSNYNGRDVSCFNSCNGSVSVNVIGATAPTYSWSPGGATTQSVTNRCPGVYTVTVTNLAGTGCTSTSSVTVQNTPQLLAAPAATSNFNGYNVSCHGDHNGTAAANASGGTAPYSYSWNTTPVQTTATATNLGAGNYTVTVTDANGCTTSGNVTITEPPLLTVTAAPTTNYNGYNVRCHGGSDGAAEASPLGGVPPYSYSWSPSAQTTKVATNLMATTYTVTVTDANGCTATNSTTLTEPPQLTIDAGPNKVVYYGFPDSACTNLTATNIGGGVPPLSIQWSTSSTATTINVCPITTTVYYVTVIDANNCTWTDSVKVCVIDVRCGTNLNKVEMCHYTNDPDNPYTTICVSIVGAQNHFASNHGDQLAACGTNKACDFPPSLARMVGNAELREDAFLTAFPNPMSDYTTVRFKLPLDEHASLKLYDMSGRVMASLFNEDARGKRVYDLRLNGSRLASGIYFLVLKTDSGQSFNTRLTITK